MIKNLIDLTSCFNIRLFKELFYKLYIPIFVLFLIIIVVGYENKIGIAVFTRDPAVIASDRKIIPLIDPKHNPFIGVVSQIGILFWCISASLSLFCSVIVARKKNLYLDLSNFLGCFGLLTSFLLLDDLFMLHESIFPELLKISEKATYSCYALLIIGGLVKFKKIILQTEWTILLLSFFWFFCSISTDLVSESITFSGIAKHLHFLLEDGFKLLGIVTWFYYCLRVCLSSTKKII